MFFLIIVIISSILLVLNIYNSYQFKHNDLSINIQNELNKKEQYLINKIKYEFNINVKIPIIISNKMPNNLYGLATFDKEEKITIYLNKKMFQESKDYMINNVLAHEYAHALMFVFGNTTNKNGGHTKQWQNICKRIDGIKCERFVNSNDIIINKRNLF